MVIDGMLNEVLESIFLILAPTVDGNTWHNSMATTEAAWTGAFYRSDAGRTADPKVVAPTGIAGDV